MAQSFITAGVLPHFRDQEVDTHGGFLVPPRSDVAKPGVEPTTYKWKRILLNVYFVKTDHCTGEEEIQVRMCKVHRDPAFKIDQDITKFYFARKPKEEISYL